MNPTLLIVYSYAINESFFGNVVSDFRLISTCCHSEDSPISFTLGKRTKYQQTSPNPIVGQILNRRHSTFATSQGLLSVHMSGMTSNSVSQVFGQDRTWY